MIPIGVLCNVDTQADPREQLSPSVVNRAWLVGRLLATEDIRLFLYCPKDVDETGEVPGYVLEGEEPVAARRPVPRVNANWSYRTRQLLRHGMGYQPFKRWMRERGNEVYVPYEFSELVSNKLETYEAVCKLDPSLHPHTEEFSGSPTQIETFLARAESVFIKPRAGHKGNRIFVLRRAGRGCSLEYYDSKARRSFPCLSLDSILGLVDAATSRERYVVQEGVQSLRYEGAVFDVRVVMVHDGRSWHPLFESRLAPRGSELSNVYQGGTIHVTREVLAGTVGEPECRIVEDRLREVSDALARHFESRFPGALSEIGFDFVIDQDRAPRLVEVNAKPGIAGIGSERKVFDWTDEERGLHEQWTIPHMKHLAGFLRNKAAAA
ncbi:MAG: YheC/YheD family protein [Candidatus Eisenbacteria bacterium]